MSTTSIRAGGLCGEVEERLADLLDGSAGAHLYEHVAECDACRDLKYEAERAAEGVARAGGDFRPASDFVEAMLAKIEEARPSSKATSGMVAKKVTTTVDTAASLKDPVALATLEGAKTELSPLAFMQREEKQDIQDAAFRTVIDPKPLFEEEAEPPNKILAAQAPDRMDPQNDVRSSEPQSDVRPGKTQLSEVQSAAVRPAGPTVSDEGGPAVATPSAVSATSHHAIDSARNREGDRTQGSGHGVSATLPEAGKAVVTKPKGAKVSFFRRRAVIAGAIGTMAVAAGAAFLLRNKLSPTTPVAAESPWSGKIASVARASADKAGGVERCNKEGKCWPLENGADVAVPTTLKTDARTRAYLTLADGTELAIDRASKVWLGAGKDRAARVDEGMVVIDVAKLEGATPAHIKIPQGDIEVLGTKLAITATKDRASVEVARGTVRVTGQKGEPVEVRAGEEATFDRDGAPLVASSTSLADVMEWSDHTSEEVDAPVLRGLGELRARKPGSTQEKDRAVRLTKHSVKVRIVDVVARTEVDETFTNDTDEELEGIFRFPLPPGAQIERLGLEVDGKVLDGAFVDRDRGAAIWRGVIQNAAPKAPKPREEIVWVPGPWRDPALLEWQRGGRFELRIFPIPKRGSRRVVLAYTQVVDQTAGIRRFSLPLAHDDSGTTKVGDFSVDLQVLGHDKDFGIQTRGYELTSASADGAAERRTMNATDFTPAGDLTVEYAMPDRDRRVTAWAYKADPATQVSATTTAAAKSNTPEEKAAIEAAQAMVNDTSPYVAISVRPKLPRWQEAKERLHVIAVDTSRSMVGERFARATRLASSIVKEMDRRDQFIMLACDTGCRPMDNAKPRWPGATAASDVDRFFGSIEPDGGSDLSATMIAAKAAAGSAPGKELRIIYLGDGTPSVGPTRPSHLETAVRHAIPAGDTSVVAVALGSDADTTSLQALARGGGGVMVPYVPGQKVATAAQTVLGAAYGLMLRDPQVELPAGLTQVTPAKLDPIRAGDEAFIVARMSSGSEVNGSIRLWGKVAGERFEQTYPVNIVASTSAGNAFVPRLFAAAKIAELERIGGEAQKPTIIELSKRFSVASRFTSLLVLESEAMFKAFGLDRGGLTSAFTGEEQAVSVSADAEGEPADDADGADVGFGRRGDEAKNRKSLDAADPFEVPSGSVLGGSSQASGPPAKAPAPKPAATRAPPQLACSPNDPLCGVFDDPLPRDRVSRPSRRRIPMRRVFDRNVSFDATNTLAAQNASKIAEAENALTSTPDSRDKTVALYKLFATSGRLGEAQELTARWSGRDALDPDALIARADLAARQGDRDRAMRILGGLADVRPNDKAIQTRLADLHETANAPAFACQNRLALADLAPADTKLVTDAIQCARLQGMNDLANQVRIDLDAKVRDAVDRLLAAPPKSSSVTNVRGDIQITADWTGGADLDIAVIDDQGRRISWLGSPSKTVTVSARDVTSTRTESLGLLGLPKGNFVVEISRASATDGQVDTIRGDLTLKLVGETRKIPFTLTGSRLELGAMRVFFTSRLVPLQGFGWGVP